jgi:tetratricopeptide (TPR) repeat protein
MTLLFRTLPIIALMGLLSGCSWMPFSLPFFDDEQPVAAKKTAPQETIVVKGGVSPEARKNLELARKYWTESGECLDPAKALLLLDKAVEADPLDPAPYLLRSRALSDLGYLNEAFDDATKAIRLSPSAEAYANRGLLCLKQNHPKGAQRDFEYAVKLDPKEPLVYIYRAGAAFLEGRKGDACDDLEQACSLGRCLPWEKAKKEKVCR